MGKSVENLGFSAVYIFSFGPSRSAEIFREIRKYHRFRFIYSKQFKLFEPHLDLY